MLLLVYVPALAQHGDQIFMELFKNSAAAADPLERQVPLVVNMTLRWGEMTLRDEILEGQNWGSMGVFRAWDP